VQHFRTSLICEQQDLIRDSAVVRKQQPLMRILNRLSNARNLGNARNITDLYRAVIGHLHVVTGPALAL